MSQSSTQAASSQTGGVGNDRHFASTLKRFVQGGSLILLTYLVLYAIYGVLEPRALESYAIAALMNNTAPLALAAAGLTFVILSRGFDLSLAGVISICNVTLAVWPMEGPGGALASVLLCLAIGGFVGAINGILVAWFQLQSIAATLATMIICQGVALVILDAPGGYVAEWIVYEMTDRLWGVIPVSGLVVLAVLGVWMILRRTGFGTAIYAVGADEQAAALSGVRVQHVRFGAYVCAGLLYGLAGFMLSAQTATGIPTSGAPLLLLSFAAVALGGTSLAGGSGGLFASVIGAATLTLLQKVLFSAGISSFYTGMFQGVVLILAVVFSVTMSRIGAKQ
ncbi:ABC transporter permease [Aquamicrobium segne]|uniref:ABC transporter permease n=1 Tax=Aquamicrobium segne TaxID=469547 RepID=A0ABW0GYD2_9HYPH